jgi:hypothetical protein
MLEKTPGWPNICKLRIIHLFEADYNLFLKLIWGKRLIRQADGLKILHPQQHARPRRTCIQPILLRQLTFDLCRQTRTDLSLFDLDATACYDRIIVCLAMLAARKCGMPEGPVSTHAEALRFMKYTVKTVYGTSEDSYQGTIYEPLFGTGQGSGGSPAAWATLVVNLLAAIDRLVPERMHFVSPDQTLESKRLTDAFVDDTNIGFTSTDESYSAQLLKLQSIVQTWERLLFYSGGALNLQKCFYYIIHWHWVNGQPTVYSPTTADPTIHLTGGMDHTPQAIQRRTYDSAERTLGAYISPSGSSDEQLKQLRLKAQAMAAGIARARLTPQQARTWHDCYYFRSVGFPLPTLATDEENLDSVQRPAIAPLLQQLGYNRHMPREVVFGPKALGGINLFDLKTAYGVEALLFFQESVFRRDDVGTAALISLQTSQLEAGIQTPLLQDTSVHVPYLTPTWILSIRQFMYNHHLSLQVTESLNLTPTCQEDACIMDVALSLNLSTNDLRTINLVRLFFKVIYISDLATGCGTQVHAHFYTTNRPSDRESTYNWPRQPTITSTQLRTWTRFLAQSITKTASHYLRRSLSKQGPSAHMNWRYHMDYDRRVIYDTTTAQCADVRNIRRNRGISGSWRPTVAQPTRLIPVSLEQQNIRYGTSTLTLDPTHAVPYFSSFQEYTAHCRSRNSNSSQTLSSFLRSQL